MRPRPRPLQWADRFVRCPLCGCSLRLLCAEYFDGYTTRCFCLGLAGGRNPRPPFRLSLSKRLKGHHLRWMCRGVRERAQERQVS